MDPSDGQANKISADSDVKVLNKAQPGQNKQAFSTSKSTGALDKLHAYQQLKDGFQEQDAEQQSQLDQTPSNVKKMILAFESSPVKEESSVTNITWETTQLSSTTVDIPYKAPSIKKIVAVNTKPVFSKLETSPTSTPEEIEEERRKLLLAHLSSKATVDTISKVPILEKTFVINTKPSLSNLDSTTARSTPEKIRNIRGKPLPATNKTREMAQLTSTTKVDITSKVPILKKTVVANTKPVLSKLETAPALSTPEDVGKERGKLLPGNNSTKETAQLSRITRVDTPFKMPILRKIAAENSNTNLSNPETATACSILKRIGKQRGKDGDYRSTYQGISEENNISNTRPSKEENKVEGKPLKMLHTSPFSERSIFSLKTIVEALPRRKQFSTDSSNENYGFTTNEPFVTEKKWRSNQWKYCHRREKSKVYHENEHQTIESFCGWIFLDEMIGSCVLSDDRPFVGLEDCLSNCSQDNDQEKLTNTGKAQSKSVKDSIESKNVESNRRPNHISFPGPAGQVVKIAIMAGFGLLVFLTRQRK